MPREPKERNIPSSFASFGADTKKARIALGYSQKDFAEKLQIEPRYLASIENSGAMPGFRVFLEIVSICNLPTEQYFHAEATQARDNKEREHMILKLHKCPKKYLPLIENTLDTLIELEREKSE